MEEIVMKPTDLMIGDWVCLKDDVQYESPMKVDGILAHNISLEGEGFLGDADEIISPIPLTAEILEKNGFKYKTTDWDVVYEGPHYGKYNLKKFHVLIGKENITLASYYGYIGHGDVDAHGFAHINYVHELQHALRLCGLNELADNFKL